MATRWSDALRTNTDYAQTIWLPVTKQSPCPICGKPDYCCVTDAGDVVYCMRTESDRPKNARDGSVGYIHQLGDTIGDSFTPRPRRRIYSRKPDVSLLDFEAINRRRLEKTSKADLESFAKKLCVSTISLLTFPSTRAYNTRSWTFPMRDENGRTIGIRHRGDDGGRWCETGSKPGLFYGKDWKDARTIYICEGPTDTASLITIGLQAIGRSNCNSGSPQLQKMLNKRRVVIVGDRDEPKVRPDGTTFYPGQEGAERLRQQLEGICGSVKVILPPEPYKDVRQWVANGATAFDIMERKGTT